MLEYVFATIFVVLFVKPIHLTNTIKAIELAMIIYISHKNALLGVVCAILFITQMPVEGMITIRKNPTRMALDEQVRPKDSNSIPVTKQGGLPPQDVLIGQMAKPYIDSPVGNYNPF
jgi:hypothetical protein